MSTLTTNYNLIKPGVNDATDQDLWGGYLNTDLDSLDSLMKIATDHIIRDITTTDTVLITDRNKMLLCDASGGAFDETLLPAATAGDGFSVTIVKSDSSANAVTVEGDGSETISGALTYVLSNEGDAIMLSCDGANWFITSSSVIAQDASETVKGIIELATQAEVDAGTDAVRAVTPATLSSNLTTNIGFNSFYESAEQTVPTNSSVTLTHGLGAIPKLMIVELVCKVIDQGYAVGDRITVDSFVGSGSTQGFGTAYSSTEIFIIGETTLQFLNKTSGQIVNLTNSSWRAVARAWA